MALIMIKRISFLSVLIAISLVCFSSEACPQVSMTSPCDKPGNAELPSLLKKGSIGELTWWGDGHFGSYICDWSSSHLKATGKAPVRAVPADGRDEDDVEYEYWRAVGSWSCMYSAVSAMDGNTGTAWCEGKKDEGIGEILIVKTDTTKPVRIWNGLGASDSLYKANNRVQRARIWVLQAKQARQEIGQYDIGIAYEDITVLGSHEITIKDRNGWQPLPLPPHKRLAFKSVSRSVEPEVKPEDSTFLAIEILSVYKGAKYNDTCISEIGCGKVK